MNIQIGSELVIVRHGWNGPSYCNKKYQVKKFYKNGNFILEDDEHTPPRQFYVTGDRTARRAGGGARYAYDRCLELVDDQLEMKIKNQKDQDERRNRVHKVKKWLADKSHHQWLNDQQLDLIEQAMMIDKHKENF